MSEYQYYEFLSIDQPLSSTDQQMLRSLSSRAQITSSSFINVYHWGNFKGQPETLMETCFDMHVYVTNWGSRRLMLRVPKQLVDATSLSHLEGLGGINVRHKKQNTIFDLWADDVFSDDMESYGDIEGTSWMSALAPLRTDIMSGDMRLFYLLWLAAIARGDICDTAPEPLAGLGTLTSALQAAVEFFDVDQDIVAAATQPDTLLPPKTRSCDILASLSEEEKTNFLTRIIDGDIYAVPELRQLARRTEGSDVPKRTAGELRAQAETIRHMG